MNLTRLDEQIAAEIPQLPDLGITTLKVFTAYNSRLRLQDGEIFRALRIARENGLLTMVHAENGDVIDILVAEALAEGHTTPEWHAHTRPAWGVVEAVLRSSALAAQANAPLYIVHMNVAGEVDQLQYSRQHGLHIMGETCPQYLFFTIDHMRRPDGAKWICSPPVRTAVDNERIWQGLADGTIQVVATDHWVRRPVRRPWRPHRPHTRPPAYDAPMGDWRGALRADPTDWLLEPSEPAVRHLTLRHLLDEPDDAPAVAKARRAAMRADPIASILAAQAPEGYWQKPGPGYAKKYTGTVWSLMFLDQMGADPQDRRVRRACDYVLEHSAATTGGFAASGSHVDRAPPPSGVIHCLNGNLLRTFR